MVNAKEMALAAAKALDSKKGRDIKVLEIDKITTLADYFVICSGGSNTQINALCDEVEKELDQLGEQPIHREGYRGGTWVLLDYGCVAVHVFNEEAYLRSMGWSACGATTALVSPACDAGRGKIKRKNRSDCKYRRRKS
ncbi:MAG: ribosome silencing factor [Oscillospiraceae bacterium]